MVRRRVHICAAVVGRGRWAADASGRHYIQSGRQLLLSLALPADIGQVARALRDVGLAAIVLPDFARRLAASAYALFLRGIDFDCEIRLSGKSLQNSAYFSFVCGCVF